MCPCEPGARQALPASHLRSPDIHVAGIYGQTKVFLGALAGFTGYCLPCRVEAQVSELKPSIQEFDPGKAQSYGAGGIVFRHSGCYHPSVAIIAGGPLCLTVMVAEGCFGFWQG